MLFNDFVHKYNLKNKATSKIKNFRVLSSFGLDKVGKYLRDGPFKSDIGIVNLHPTKGTHWIANIDENYSDSYGCSPQKLSKLITKRNGHCLYSENRRQGLTSKRDSYCAAYCLYIIYLTKKLRIDFKPAVLKLY